jgi:hypothetical protein
MRLEEIQGRQMNWIDWLVLVIVRAIAYSPGGESLRDSK